MTYDYRDAVIDELRSALLVLIDAPPGGTMNNIARRKHAYDLAQAAWINSASTDTKELVLRLAKLRIDSDSPPPATYLDAVGMFGRQLVIEAEQALK